MDTDRSDSMTRNSLSIDEAEFLKQQRALELQKEEHDRRMSLIEQKHLELLRTFEKSQTEVIKDNQADVRYVIM